MAVDGVGRRQMNAKHRLGDGIASIERECTQDGAGSPPMNPR